MNFGDSTVGHCGEAAARNSDRQGNVLSAAAKQSGAAYRLRIALRLFARHE